MHPKSSMHDVGGGQMETGNDTNIQECMTQEGADGKSHAACKILGIPLERPSISSARFRFSRSEEFSFLIQAFLYKFLARSRTRKVCCSKWERVVALELCLVWRSRGCMTCLRGSVARRPSKALCCSMMEGSSSNAQGNEGMRTPIYTSLAYWTSLNLKVFTLKLGDRKRFEWNSTVCTSSQCSDFIMTLIADFACEMLCK